MPPKTTARESTQRAMAISTGGMWKASPNADDMVLAWTMLFVRPNWAIMATAKMQANQRLWSPLVIYQAGPPMKESLPLLLKSWASVHSMKVLTLPMRAITHIQKIAPGPPTTIAVATPARFPVPTLEARDTIKA